MYTLDADSAKKADSRGNRINETGAYVVTVTYLVEIPPNSNGTKGFGLKVKSKDGQEAYLALYTHSGKGVTLPSYNVLNALMTCARIRTLTPTPSTITKWDVEAKKEVQVEANVCPELAGKTIGIFVEMENSFYMGASRTKPVLVGAFEPETLFTAKEILDKKTKPENYEKFILTLKDRTNSKEKPKASSSSSPKPIEFDDDIPF